MSSAEAGPARVTLSRRSLVRGAFAAARRGSGAGRLRQRRLPAALRRHASGAGLQERLAQVDVAPIPGRVGQRIRNELIFQSTGGGDAAAADAPARGGDQASRSLSTLVKIDGDAARARSMPSRPRSSSINIKDKQVVLKGIEPRPRRLRALPVDLFQRARPRGRREPRGANRRRRPQDAACDVPVQRGVSCRVAERRTAVRVHAWSPSRRTRPTPS